MFRKLGLSVVAGCLMFAAQTAAATPSAEAAVRCVAVAERINGERVRGTRTPVERRREHRACNIALQVCEDKLEHARFALRRPMPFARCQVVRLRHVGFHGHHRRYAPPPAYAPHCNIHACSHRYRSFRPSDCTFQPYHGPRKYCRL